MKLTPAQAFFLKEVVSAGGCKAIETYAPVVKLLALGLIQQTSPPRAGLPTWGATADGLEWVKNR